MVNLIIFSKDRACQLELLLESMVENCAGQFDNISILYKASNEEFKEGYDYLKLTSKKFGTEDEYFFNWVEQSDDFKSDLIGLMDNKYENTCFLTDDDVFYNPIEIKEIEPFLDDEDIFCFSLRLGRNITYSHGLKTKNILHDEEEIGDNFMKWDWVKHYVDFGQPLSINGHIFRTREIKKMSKKIKFDNPADYEIEIQHDYYPRELMMSYRKGTVVNFSLNTAKDVMMRKETDDYEYSIERLNERYLKGERIDYGSIDFSEIDGCYKKFEFETYFEDTVKLGREMHYLSKISGKIKEIENKLENDEK